MLFFSNKVVMFLCSHLKGQGRGRGRGGRGRPQQHSKESLDEDMDKHNRKTKDGLDEEMEQYTKQGDAAAPMQ